MSVWHELLSNLAVVAITTAVWTFSYHQICSRTRTFQSVSLGLIMSLGVLCVMALPFHFREGVYLDTRYTFLALSGFFGGPLGAVLPLVTALARRIVIGGTGMSIAIPHILAATVFGLLGWNLRQRAIPSTKSLIWLSCAVAVSGTFGFYLALPISVWGQLTKDTVLPFAGILFGASLLAASALTQELHRHTATMENEVYRAIIEALPDCLNAKDMDGRFIVANPATARLMGVTSQEDLQGKTDADFYPAATAAIFRQVELDVLEKAEPTRLRQNFTRIDGNETWLSTLKAPLRDRNGDLIGLITHNKDVTEQRRLEVVLAETKGRLEDALGSMADGLAMFDAQGLLVFQNDKHLELFPLTADLRQPGAALTDIVRASLELGEIAQSENCIIARSKRMAAELLEPGNRRFPLGNGRWIETRTRLSANGGVTLVFSDISELRKREHELSRLNAKLAALAETDGLTGVANRRSFDKAFQDAVDTACRGVSDVGLLMIDVDFFKAFNDTYGHPAGDQCLKQIASVIFALLESAAGVTVARYGGEEFAVILPGMGEADTIDVAQRLCRAIKDLALEHVGSEKSIVTASIGAATWLSSSFRDKGRFLRQADEALYEAKLAGRGCVRGLKFSQAA